MNLNYVFFYREMKMNVDLKSDPSREIGVDMFNHSNDSTHCDDSDDNEDEEEDEVQEEEEEDEENLVEEEGEEEYDDDDDDDDGDDDDDDDGDDDDDEDEDDDCESNGGNVLKVAPRDLHTNRSSSALHDMSKICWPPGSWHDGTRKSAFQPYRVGCVVVDPKIKKGVISAKLNDSGIYQYLFHWSSNFWLVFYVY